MTTRAGVATADITPPVGAAMSGFAARLARSTGVHDTLSARAIAVSHGEGASLIVVADLVALTIDQAEDLRVEIADRTGIDRAAVTVSATHTHGGPQVTPDGLGPTASPLAIERACRGIVDAATTAWRSRSPARLRSGTAAEPTVASNRRRPGGPIDPTVSAVAFDDPDGRVRAVLFSYACHPVVLGPDNLRFTADWPGAARAMVERMLPGAVAVFAQGCCGEVNTGHTAYDSMRRVASPNRTFAECERVGGLVGAAAARAVTSARPADGPISSTSEPVELPFDPVDPAALARDVAQWRDAMSSADDQLRVILGGKIEWAHHHAGRPPASLAATVSAHRWGEVTIVAVPGEPFLGVAADITTGLGRASTVVLGYSNGVPGYVPYPSEEYAAGGYEVEEAHCFYGQPHRFAPSCGATLVAAGVTAAARLHEPSPPGGEAAR
jgi:hypothetical protein